VSGLKNYGIILAAGSGVRYGTDMPKQFVKIAGKTILEHTVEIFEKSKMIDQIIVVITPEYKEKANDILNKNDYKKIFKVISGGKTRKESSYIGISAINDDEANVIIHDCARPFLTERIINDCISALQKYDAVDVAIPSADTIIKTNSSTIVDIPERANLKRGQTPQCFKLSVIKKAHNLAKDDDNFTDDCGLIIKYNLGEVYVVEGDIENIKITYPVDIYMADRLFQLRTNVSPSSTDLNEINGKVMVIFGGTGGIGQCTANLAQKYGAKVYSTSLSKGCDITDYSEVEKYLEQIINIESRIDYVINAVGTLKIGEFANREISDIYSDVNVNYIGAINIIKASIPYLKESKGAIQLYSSSSYTRGRATYSIYSSAKAAIVNLAQALAEELYDDGIKINVINPERTATKMRYKAFGEEPRGSLLLPEKVAEVSLKTLLSDFTGQVIDVKRVEG